MTNLFHSSVRRAIQQAIRYGALACNPCAIEIQETILGLERPFATIKYSEIKDENAKEALAILQH